MQKSMLIALGVVIMLSTLVVLVDDDVDAVGSTPELLGIEGTGTESDPYQVDTADDLNVIDELSTAMRAGTSIHVVLVNDIDITGVEVNSDGDFIYGFRGTFDGNGYSITGVSTTANYLFYRVYGDSSLTDIVLDTDSTFTMVLAQNDGDFLMSDITVDGWGTGTLSGGNESPFIAHTFGNLTMENCTNNADLVLGNYGAVFLGGYARGEGIEVTFRNCVNNGSILGSSPSLFIGNPWQTEIGVLTIEGCANNKDIIGTTNAKYIAAYSGTGYGGFFDDLNEACAKDSETTTGNPTAWQEGGNYARVGTFSIEAIAGDGVPRTNTVDLTLNLSTDPYSATTNEASADYVVFTIGAYAQGNGTWMTTIVGSEVPISSGSADLDLSVGMLTTYELAKLEYQEVPTSPTGVTSNGFPYYQFSVNGTAVYAVDFGDAEWSFTDVTSVTIGVTLYAEDGSQLAYKHGDVDVVRPTPTVSGAESTTFHKVYVVNEDYVDVNLDSRYVADGTTLEFTISPKAGYTLADEIIAITASADIRRMRAIERGMSAEDFEARASLQPSEEELCSLASLVIDNASGDDSLFAALDAWMADKGLLPGQMSLDGLDA